ncbi:hypothetical protein HALDL1_04290 [Halobacterium sp. DL1]|nr:hypothetical protein HALDL1_04290 [Halobacterium sp. DL1]
MNLCKGTFDFSTPLEPDNALDSTGCDSLSGFMRCRTHPDCPTHRGMASTSIIFAILVGPPSRYKSVEDSLLCYGK